MFFKGLFEAVATKQANKNSDIFVKVPKSISGIIRDVRPTPQHLCRSSLGQGVHSALL